MPICRGRAFYGADSRARHEQHPDGEYGNRQAGHQPGLEPAEPGVRPVNEEPQGRVEPKIKQPHDAEGEADRAQADIEIPGVIVGEVDDDRHVHGCHRNARQRKGRQAPSRLEPVSAASTLIVRTPLITRVSLSDIAGKSHAKHSPGRVLSAAGPPDAGTGTFATARGTFLCRGTAQNGAS